MIPVYDFLDEIHQSLARYRGDGLTDILFDTRDDGNYGGYDWSSTVSMLKKADPTGLSVAMLLNEMIEATINGSKVSLSRVLLEDGFFDHLKSVLDIRQRLLDRMSVPMTLMIDRVNAALAATSEKFGIATQREVAIFLRDAIYSIENGLTMRWIQCDDVAQESRVALSSSIAQYAGVPEFVTALRGSMPWGAHVARIGHDGTAIAIKQPGRIAYLSTLSINRHSGKLREERARSSGLSERFDLDHATERYPEWSTAGADKQAYGTRSVAIPHTHTLNQLAVLPRDRVIWLAMLVEIASQRMASTDWRSVALSESLENALARPVSSSLAPALITPNWTTQELTIEKGLRALRLSDWELRFLAPATAGLSADIFLPLGEEHLDMDLATRTLQAKPANRFSEDRGTTCAIVAFSLSVVGTRQEVEEARQTIFQSNLFQYLMAWGNREFARQWEGSKAWFEKKLKAKLPKALTASCARLMPHDHYLMSAIHLYQQSAKHKTYNARCYFNAKSLVTDVVDFCPMTSGDVVEMLGLGGEKDLPAFLQGWRRNLGWTTQNLSKRRMGNCPVDSNSAWFFVEIRSILVRATVCVNKANIDTALQKLWLNHEPALAPMDLEKIGAFNS